jgi:hypothetical protein
MAKATAAQLSAQKKFKAAIEAAKKDFKAGKSRTWAAAVKKAFKK